LKAISASFSAPGILKSREKWFEILVSILYLLLTSCFLCITLGFDF
jgi:hypothetical protein